MMYLRPPSLQVKMSALLKVWQDALLGVLAESDTMLAILGHSRAGGQSHISVAQKSILKVVP